MDKLTAAIAAYNRHTEQCRHGGSTHAETCWGGSELMAQIVKTAKQMGAR